MVTEVLASDHPQCLQYALTSAESPDALLENYDTLTQELHQHLTRSNSVPLKKQQHHSKTWMNKDCVNAKKVLVDATVHLPDLCIQYYTNSCIRPATEEEILQTTADMQEKGSH